MVSALSLSIAQRLARKLCTACKKPTENPDEKDVQLLRDILAHATAVGKDIGKYQLTPDMPITLYEPVGCDACNHTGFKGRIGIFEAILTNEAIEKIIPENPSEREIKRTAEAQGIFNMKEDGTVKILRGVTSLEEVKSVVDMYEE